MYKVLETHASPAFQRGAKNLAPAREDSICNSNGVGIDAKKIASCDCREKIASCLTAMSHTYVDLRHVDRQHIDIRCVDCGADLSGRQDWEPFVQMCCTSETPLIRLGESEKINVEHCRICCACLEICARIDAAEFWSNGKEDIKCLKMSG